MKNLRYKKRDSYFLHPAILLLFVFFIIISFLKWNAPLKTRSRAYANISLKKKFNPRNATKSENVPNLNSLLLDASDEADDNIEDDSFPLYFPSAPNFDDWYIDIQLDKAYCSFEYDPSLDGKLEIYNQRLKNGMNLLMSKQDIIFLAWTSYLYRINPHFLMGVMYAESGGDCSAVSSAGAQGCFQITYRQGAGQLKNSYPKRIESWYWAPRSNISSNNSGRYYAGEALGFWPSDLYIPPEVYFNQKLSPRTRQLRMTRDSVATLLDSDKNGETEISSVANFSFGVIGAGLYFHYLNHYLYFHELQLKGDVRELVSIPRQKLFWMAASYNQGAPRTMRMLGVYGPKNIWGYLNHDVYQYASLISNICEQLQQSPKYYKAFLTWGEFSNFLQELRWTYSEIDIDWDNLRIFLEKKFFTKGKTITIENDLLTIFDAMQEFDSDFKAEIPILDHRVKF